MVRIGRDARVKARPIGRNRERDRNGRCRRRQLYQGGRVVDEVLSRSEFGPFRQRVEREKLLAGLASDGEVASVIRIHGGLKYWSPPLAHAHLGAERSSPSDNDRPPRNKEHRQEGWGY